MKEQNFAFVSSYFNDIEEFLLKGETVSAFIQINDDRYPQGLVVRSAGTPNCLIKVDNGIDVIHLGVNKGLVMQKKETVLCHFDVAEIQTIDLSLRKSLATIGGRYLLLLKLTAKDGRAFNFWIDSLKAAILIWNSTELAPVNKHVDELFIPYLTMEHFQTITEELDGISDKIPLFYE